MYNIISFLKEVEKLHIFSELLYPESVRVIGYDPMKDSEWELCVIFRAIPEEHKVQLVERHRRSHMNPENCERITEIEPEEVEFFDKMLPDFYDEAMRYFGFKAFDDSLPELQLELPVS